jgi:hypothetical protein
MKNFLITLLISVFVLECTGQNWQIDNTRSISKTNPLTYSDNIEMSGKKVAGIIHYRIDSLGLLSLEREIIYPQLRKHIGENDSRWAVYRAYLKDIWTDDVEPKIYVNALQWSPGIISKININGSLVFYHETSKSGISLKRTFLPTVDQRLFLEQWELKNNADTIVEINIGNTNVEERTFGHGGVYVHGVSTKAKERLTLAPEESYTFDIQYFAIQQGDSVLETEGAKEKREQLLDEIHDKLILKTPISELNTLFAFSKVRAAESIFDSKMGMVHSPGGGRYYAGVWANDQAEYSGPFFPYLGLKDGNVAALNAYKRFYEQMMTIPNHDQNLWSSFEMNGDYTCCGGDRGDAAMIAYGGLHYLMALGDKAIAKEYQPMIDWCLAYNHKKLNAEGVVLSDTDEMEGRIETGSANLSTSALYYGALDLAIDYYTALDSEEAIIQELKIRKAALKASIEAYFGASVEGLDTYKYFKEHTHLRHWICLPLVVGIDNRRDATVEALFDRLWTANGVHVEKNSENPAISKIFWDRGTLYALRGTFIAGEIKKSLQKLEEFSRKRLLGDRVPYVVEAFPEGNMAHLSAESALYCRVFIEGMFGIKPVGFNSFILTPRMPADWDQMSLQKIQAFGAEYSIEVNRKNTSLQLIVTCPSKGMRKMYDIKDGESCIVEL